MAQSPGFPSIGGVRGRLREIAATQDQQITGQLMAGSEVTDLALAQLKEAEQKFEDAAAAKNAAASSNDPEEAAAASGAAAQLTEQGQQFIYMAKQQLGGYAMAGVQLTTHSEEIRDELNMRIGLTNNDAGLEALGQAQRQPEGIENTARYAQAADDALSTHMSEPGSTEEAQAYISNCNHDIENSILLGQGLSNNINDYVGRI